MVVALREEADAEVLAQGYGRVVLRPVARWISPAVSGGTGVEGAGEDRRRGAYGAAAYVQRSKRTPDTACSAYTSWSATYGSGSRAHLRVPVQSADGPNL